MKSYFFVLAVVFYAQDLQGVKLKVLSENTILVGQKYVITCLVFCRFDF